MNRRFQTFVTISAILLMAVPPLFELVDKWDNIPATGNDTAITLIVIGACIGLCFVSAFLIVRVVTLLLSLFIGVLPEMAPTAQPNSFGADHLRLLFSPPVSFTSLRI